MHLPLGEVVQGPPREVAGHRHVLHPGARDQLGELVGPEQVHPVVAQRLAGISDSIARSFFTHTQAAKPVGFTVRPPRDAVAA